jgi:hypothetical protein
VEVDREILPYLANALSAKAGEWIVDGDTIRHHDITITALSEYSSAQFHDTVHAHIGFYLTRSKILWDCSVSIGSERNAALQNLVDGWMKTTGSTIIELITQNGRLATRFRPNDEGGFPGWHSIRSDPIVMSLQAEDLRPNVERAVRWCNTVNPLRAVREAVTPYLDTGPHGLKFFMAGNSEVAAGSGRDASVELDGDECEAAAHVLRQLPVPGLSGMTWLRFYCLLLFPAARTSDQ